MPKTLKQLWEEWRSIAMQRHYDGGGYSKSGQPFNDCADELEAWAKEWAYSQQGRDWGGQFLVQEILGLPWEDADGEKG